MPARAWTKIDPCRKQRDGNTGMATNGRGSRWQVTQYDDSDISATSNSRWRSIRKNVSSTGIARKLTSMPSGRTRPSAIACTRS